MMNDTIYVQFSQVFFIYSAPSNNYKTDSWFYFGLLLNIHAPLIGRLTHAWASDANNNRAAVLNQARH